MHEVVDRVAGEIEIADGGYHPLEIAHAAAPSLAMTVLAGALQMHAAISETDPFGLEHRNDTMQGTRLGVGNAAARTFPSREARTRD
jgi:hypothetical protein